MSQSTWHNITHGMRNALDKSYKSKTTKARRRAEVRRIWDDFEPFCQRTEAELADGTYGMGDYRHYWLRDKKKQRYISVLPFRDRAVQNDLKEAVEPILLRMTTDDMLGGLPGKGILVGDVVKGVARRMRVVMNNRRLTHYLLADIVKCYDHIDNVTAMRLVERKVKDKRTLALIRQHLFKQKRLAIGDPMSHLVANITIAEIVREVKRKHPRVTLVNFADNFFIASDSEDEMKAVRRTMHRKARDLRLHLHPVYIRQMPDRGETMTFCGYKYGRGFVHLKQDTKKRYVKSRHKRRSTGSYKGLLQVADTKRLRKIVEQKDNRHMTEKIRRPFAGRPMKIETMEGIAHTIVDFQEKPSRQRDCDHYYHVQAIAEGLGLIVYSTGSQKICEYLSAKSRRDIPLRDMKIVHDWSGFYYEGTVYTDAEEEQMIRQQFGL